MTEHTHETDKALKLKAYSGALAATLPDGVMLTDEERWELQQMVWDNEAADESERWRNKRLGGHG